MSSEQLPAAHRELPVGFAQQLIDWQRVAGRHGLPWQQTRDPYRVWLSEIMLQQTQVSTVLTYYPRFLQRFPDVRALAAASEDEVLALWSGLGYYSRARNLHRCAQVVVADHAGAFPASADSLQALPGIGASTAAAIAAFCFGERVSILDGNVRRVLTRLLAFGDDLAQTAAQRALWDHAQGLLPDAPSAGDMAAYTQGLMDLGATVCTRTRPRCDTCPVMTTCRAAAQGNATDYPVRSRRLTRRHEVWHLLVLLRDAGEARQVWLERRPAHGIWAGLHCVPVYPDDASLRALVPACLPADALRPLEVMAHSLTHRELRLHPWVLALPVEPALAVGTDTAAGRWVSLADLGSVGLPAPVRSLLQSLSG